MAYKFKRDTTTPIEIGVLKQNAELGNADNTSDATKNVLSATKLATARTISLTGDVTGSVSTDFSTNPSITTTVAYDSHNHSTSTITNLKAGLSYIDANTILVSGFYHCNANIPTDGEESDKAVIHNQYGNNDLWATQIAISWRYGRMWIRNKERGTWEDWFEIYSSSNKQPDVAKLTTPRTISLTGAVSGSASFDGSNNVSITTTGALASISWQGE